MLPSCIPIPYATDKYEDIPDPDNVISKLKELQSSRASRSFVIGSLGRPSQYRERYISYEACEDVLGVALVMCLFYACDGFAAYESDIKCYELRLDFDDQDKLMSYSTLPYESNFDEETEDLALKALGSQGDPIAQRLWVKSHTYRRSPEYLKELNRLPHLPSDTGNFTAITLPEKQAARLLQMYVIEPGHNYAKKWLCRSADSGYPEAQYHFGFLYEFGSDNVPRDKIRAFMWYRFAASAGEYDSRYVNNALRVNENLTDAQATAAAELIQEWKPGECKKELMDAE